MIIEKLKKDDVKKTSAFLIKNFDDMRGIFPINAISAFKSENCESEIINLMKRDTRIYLVAKNENKVIGVAHGYIYGGVFYLVWLIIEKKSRKRGIGSSLLKKLEYELKGRCHKIHLISAVDLDARGFYEKNGYSCEGMLRKAWWNVDYHSLGKVL
jgi:GNAT superfamily N-acetyltransferase